MILHTLKDRFEAALAPYVEAGNLTADQVPELLEMVRQSGDARHGDYQANIAMPLGKRLGKSPRDIAAEIIEQLDVADLCDPPEIAGPGFINLRVRDDWIVERLTGAVGDERVGVPKIDKPRTYILDYSAPNVAKPMHVGHIRSTVIGDALYRILDFLGHKVISDNHIGDWGTQFGMIMYGYRNFLNQEAYDADPVGELSRLYRLVRQIVDYHAAVAKLPEFEEKLGMLQKIVAAEEETLASLEKPTKKDRKPLNQARKTLDQLMEDFDATQSKVKKVDGDAELKSLADAHKDVGRIVLEETAKLHAGDEANIALWKEIVPACEEDIEAIYNRLGVTFDHTLGESYYQPRLGPLVDRLIEEGVARETDGAIGVFIEGYDFPMLIRKQGGGFLYATTDLATLEYRMETFKPDAILYVVDHRQSIHFEMLFKAATNVGCEGVELQHIKFGTVMQETEVPDPKKPGKTKKKLTPFKTREGDTVGLMGLLNRAVDGALEIVIENEEKKPDAEKLSETERKEIAERIGIAAIKYADLCQNRESDYLFSYEKMLATQGNTAAYMQYAYARVRSIFRKGDIDTDALLAEAAAGNATIALDHPAERALALGVLRLGEAIEATQVDYRPNQLTSYLYDLAGNYSTFFENCPVLKAETEASKKSRLLLCDLTAAALKCGLNLLGIETVKRM